MSGAGPRGVCARCRQAACADRPDADADRAERICPHHCAYPERLRGAGPQAPILRIRGGAGRLARLLAPGVVALLGTTAPSDYGSAAARRLGAELGRRGVTVAVALEQGIGLAACAGAVSVGGATIVVLDGDVGRRAPEWCEALYSAALRRGCAVWSLTRDPDSNCSSAPPSAPAASSTPPAAASILALLADLAIVVEGRRGGGELACARIRRQRGLAIAAVPGLFDAPAGRGGNQLLAGGASVVTGVGDALRLLRDSRARPARRAGRETPPPRRRQCLGGSEGVNARASSRAGRDLPSDAAGVLAAVEPALRRVLDRVLDGADTLDALRDGDEARGVELALAQLELRGLLRRSVGGRYLPRAGIHGG